MQNTARNFLFLSEEDVKYFHKQNRGSHHIVNVTPADFEDLWTGRLQHLE